MNTCPNCGDACEGYTCEDCWDEYLAYVSRSASELWQPLNTPPERNP